MDLAEVKMWRSQFSEGLALPMFDWLISEHERLTALCDGYRGEVAALKEALDRIAHPVWWMQEDQLQTTGSINGLDGAAAVALADNPRFLRGIAEKSLAGEDVGVSRKSALTRARAEGLEEGLATAERILSSRMYDNAIVAKEVDRLFTSVRAAKEACRLAEQANKGE